MIKRKKKLRFIQISLFFIGIIIIMISYSENDLSIKKKEILPKDTKKLVENELGEGESNPEGNIFYNIEYSGIDLNGNRYILKSKKAKTLEANEEILDMTGVEAFFYFKDDTTLLIQSKFGEYNNKTFDMKFFKNVEAKYKNSELFADKAEFSNSKGFLTISNNVKIIDTQGNLNADKLLIDIQDQTLNIVSFKDNKINANLKLNEKRF
jgi:hypothetical protein|tara:strand:- start:191 stop:817 length:627 start_codon:yes stop_codon:yes gene_type:complete